MPASSNTINNCVNNCANPIDVYAAGNTPAGTQCGPLSSHVDAWNCAVHKWNGKAAPFNDAGPYPHASYCLASITMGQVMGPPHEYQANIYVCSATATTRLCHATRSSTSTNRWINSRPCSRDPVRSWD